MPISPKYRAPYFPSGFYHIYNRTNNKEPLYRNDDNRRFFLRKLNHYLNPTLDLFAWSLLPNHFHLLARVKEEPAVRHNLFSSKKIQTLTNPEYRFLFENLPLHEFITDSFKRFFQSYTLAVNKTHERKGNLFNTPYKHLLIEDPQHLRQAFVYIHQNAQNHGVITDFRDYPWSSWKKRASFYTKDTLTLETHALFGGYKKFAEWHEELLTCGEEPELTEMENLFV